MAHPVVFQCTSASNSHAALERGLPALNLASIKEYVAQSGQVCIVNDIPDNVAANKKRQRRAQQQLIDEDRALYFASGCCAHLCHRIIVAATDEKKLVGYAHACAVSLALPGNRNAAHKALWELIDSNPHVMVYAPPDPT